MYLRKTEIKDLDRAEEILILAKESLRDELHIDQWQSGYPNRSTYEKDMQDGLGYVLCNDEGAVVGVCAAILDGDPVYDDIISADGEFDGFWKYDGKHLVVHRICVDKKNATKGLGSIFMEKLTDMARSLGCGSVRIDTHRGNLAMRGMLRKNGFCERGIVFVDDPSTKERIAYEKIL